MNNEYCDQLQQYLMMPRNNGLRAEDSEHLQTCPECREFHYALPGLGQMLEEIGREFGERESSVLSPELKASVRENALARLRTASTLAVGHRLEPEAETERASFLEVLKDWFGAGEPGRRFAYGCLALLLLAGIFFASRVVVDQRAIGKMVFASGEVQVERGASTEKWKGLNPVVLYKDELVKTTGASEGILSLGKNDMARLVMSRSTSLRVLADNKIDLREGEVWLRVNPEGKGFVVQTPNGLVRVTGTVFSVRVRPGATRVEVIEGTVITESGGRKQEVTAGQTLEATAKDSGLPTTRAEGLALPGWINALLDKERMASGKSYLPSFSR